MPMPMGDFRGLLRKTGSRPPSESPQAQHSAPSASAAATGDAGAPAPGDFRSVLKKWQH
eukprot:GAFH01001434.1.p10 GENE.GAFH01001434.1~~GAFH01001434.1.p10  ORF type:complete len:59 (-),score=8.33 GAFH01001434.1:77-253(-)